MPVPKAQAAPESAAWILGGVALFTFGCAATPTSQARRDSRQATRGRQAQALAFPPHPLKLTVPKVPAVLPALGAVVPFGVDGVENETPDVSADPAGYCVVGTASG